MTLSEELTWRGFTNQTTFGDVTEVDKQTRTFYWGVDPSASSMTVGNLAAAMMAKHFISHGYKAVLLVGGATGLIGDPDGKAEERKLLGTDEIAANKANIVAQYKRIFEGADFKLVDNYDWFKEIGYLQFLRDVGKHMPMSQMLQREFVQSRLGEGGAGISYAEFSYAMIQGYDFVYLFKNEGVTLQLCGADQWGNCIAGVDLIRRLTGGEAHIWSSPLIIDKVTGKKFGKSEGNAIWLDEKLTSVYKFYQFWLNVDDESVIDYLKIYTLLSKEEFEVLLQRFTADKASRIAQKSLAYEVTKLIHGQERADSVKRISEVLFGGGDYASLDASDLKTLAAELPVSETTDVLEMLVETGLANSKSEARRFLGDGAVYCNGQKCATEKLQFDTSDALQDYAIVRRGKNIFALVKLG